MFWKLSVDSSTNKILWYVCCLECFAELSSIIQILPNCAFCEVEPFGRSMEKFCISSTDRNLLSHDIGYIRVAALRGGRWGGICATGHNFWPNFSSDIWGFFFSQYSDQCDVIPVLLRATGGEGSKARHEEVKPVNIIVKIFY